MQLKLPDFALVVLIGASGSGKSSFARRHFKPTETISSDYCRGLVADDENDQSASDDAFELLRFIVGKRLAARRLAVIDATNVKPQDRKGLVELARQYHALPVAIVFNLPEAVCHARNAERADRQFGRHVVRNQIDQLRRGLRGIEREGFRIVHVLRTVEEVDAATLLREPLWNDRRDERGPFDIIGDVHGCFDELRALLDCLGYAVEERAGEGGIGDYRVTPPAGRRAIFLGDLVDRGPAVPAVLRLVMSMVADGAALCVPGNHDMKLMRKLRGREVKIAHGLAETLAQLEAEPEAIREPFARAVADFIDGLISHYMLDGGKLVVAHAGMKEAYQGRGSGTVRAFALYGETTGEIDEFGLPVRLNWAAEYRGAAHVVYGHTPVPEAEWLNHTICVDTGCVFGGKLTALRYPEMELVSVPAARVYYQPAKPLAAEPPRLSAQQEHDHLLDLDDVIGKRIVSTRLRGPVTIEAGNAAAALEVMSRFAIDPKWLIYLPPTMSPSETATADEMLERPAEAFQYFANCGIERVVVQEKHMGSRAIIVLCRDAARARARFGVATGERGIIYTRTGRRFFAEPETEAALLDRLDAAMGASGLWQLLDSDWVCLDAEIMPWSAKARSLLSQQYGPVGAAARIALGEASLALAAAQARGVELGELPRRVEARRALARAFTDSYRRYCWPVRSLADYRIAPFHLLASEGCNHMEHDHAWHMASIAALCAADPGLLLMTDHRFVSLADAEAADAAGAWWTAITARGGEGMVVKPLSFVARGARGLVQPALKCRGREYLRIIYGPEYSLPENLDRLRQRGLAKKRSLALREFALGIEALDRFVRREPLRRVHECVFAVLALESEPVDPRL